MIHSLHSGELSSYRMNTCFKSAMLHWAPLARLYQAEDMGYSYDNYVQTCPRCSLNTTYQLTGIYILILYCYPNNTISRSSTVVAILESHRSSTHRYSYSNNWLRKKYTRNAIITINIIILYRNQDEEFAQQLQNKIFIFLQLQWGRITLKLI